MPVRHRDQVWVRAGRYVREEPAVKYRGLFIDDEAPALSGWTREKFGGFNHAFYGHVFELLLRLRANFLWPAMWGNAFNDDDALNPALASEYGIVVGTSHHEPMMRAHDEWRRYGTGPWNYATNADAAEPWLRVDVARGTVDREQRIPVTARWSDVPVGTETASLTVTGPDNVRVRVVVPILNPPVPRPDTLDGFVEAHGYVSMEAEHFARAMAPAGRRWTVIPSHGRTLSGVTPWPVTAEAIPAAPEGMRLEYQMHLLSQGKVSVDVQLAPTQKFQPGAGFRYAISFDDEPPQVVNVHAHESLAAWERSVADGVRTLTTQHVVARPGRHVLKYWAIDPGLVVQKLVVRTGRPRPSYLGPPESARGVHRASPAGW